MGTKEVIIHHIWVNERVAEIYPSMTLCLKWGLYLKKREVLRDLRFQTYTYHSSRCYARQTGRHSSNYVGPS